MNTTPPLLTDEQIEAITDEAHSSLRHACSGAQGQQITIWHGIEAHVVRCTERATRAPLLAEIERLTDIGESLMDKINSLTAELAEARAALEVTRVDAERYRWLRAKNGLFYKTPNGADALRVALSHFDKTTDMWVHCLEGLDAAIDTARESTNG